jgi:hypothetical protein
MERGKNSAAFQRKRTTDVCWIGAPTNAPEQRKGSKLGWVNKSHGGLHLEGQRGRRQTPPVFARAGLELWSSQVGRITGVSLWSFDSLSLGFLSSGKTKVVGEEATSLNTHRGLGIYSHYNSNWYSHFTDEVAEALRPAFLCPKLRRKSRDWASLTQAGMFSFCTLLTLYNVTTSVF